MTASTSGGGEQPAAFLLGPLEDGSGVEGGKREGMAANFAGGGEAWGVRGGEAAPGGGGVDVETVETAAGGKVGPVRGDSG